MSSNADTVTGRALSATSSPERTRAYDRTPSTLIADTDDGTCSMSPVSAGSAARTAASSRCAADVDVDDLALGVVGDGGLAEPDRGDVLLVGQRQVAEQPGGAVDAEHQHARRHRVERAAVTDLAGARESAHPADDVVRRPP